MAVTDITAQVIDGSGYNLSDSADFTATGLGAGNGVEFLYDATDLIILRNDTGGAATFTVKVSNPANVSEIGETVSDKTISVANGKDYLLVPKPIYNGGVTSTKMTIECDVAGKVLVVNR